MDLKEVEDSVTKVTKAMKGVHRSSLKFAKHAHEYLDKTGGKIPEFLKKLMEEAKEAEKEEKAEEEEEKRKAQEDVR